MGNTNDRLAISLFAEAGSVNGDVYVFDGQLIIDSKVIGDLPAAGDRVRKSAPFRRTRVSLPITLRNGCSFKPPAAGPN
jgi:hypothetical protein